MVLNMKNLEKEIKKIFEMNFYFNENFKIGVKNKPHTYCDIPSCASKIFNLLSNIDKDLNYTDVYELVQKIYDDYVKENFLESLYKNITKNDSDIAICRI